jgi:hypothetical protein
MQVPSQGLSGLFCVQIRLNHAVQVEPFSAFRKRLSVAFGTR